MPLMKKFEVNRELILQERIGNKSRQRTSLIRKGRLNRRSRQRKIQDSILPTIITAILILSITLPGSVFKVQGLTMSRILKSNLGPYSNRMNTRPTSTFIPGFSNSLRNTNANILTKPYRLFSKPLLKLSTRNLTSKIVPQTNEINHSQISPSPSKLSPNQDPELSSLISETSDSNSNIDEDPLHLLFSMDVPEGRCVGLSLNISETQARNSDSHFWTDILESSPSHTLHPKEIEYGIDLPNNGDQTRSAQASFFLGRLAIRTGLQDLMRGINEKQSGSKLDSEGSRFVLDSDISILKDAHGRPTMPPGFLGSISHKRNTGVALVNVDSPHEKNIDDGETPKQRRGIGVDIEQSSTKRISVAKRVLTINEMNDLGNIKGVTEEEEVLLRFSLKESVYKAMHPLLCQFVGFQEAEITPHADGTATVSLNLKNGAHELFSEKDTIAHWRRIGSEFFLTSASVILK